MRIYSANYNLIAHDLIKALEAKELLEVEDDLRDEAELDIVSVLREYNRMNAWVNNKARDLARGDRAEEQRVRRRLAKEKNFPIGEDAFPYVIEQIIEMLLASGNVEEIFGDNRELRAVITPILASHTRDREDELDQMVRSKIKNLSEGSSAWDIEYERVKAQIRRTKGLSTE